ncbi:MAG: polysaccharide deacetylase family protein [Lachnospiraceae bacterium]|nr:polysaccharide deacetylase family protein [Lachnospiraceae bacterium]
MRRTLVKRVTASALALLLFCETNVLTDVSSQAAGPKLNKKNLTIRVGQSYKLKVKGKYKGKIKWKSNKKKVATVSSKGIVKGKSKGKAKITAKVAGKTMKCNVTVKAAAEKPSSSPTIVQQTATPTEQAVPTPTPTAAPVPTGTPDITPTPEPTPTPAYMAEGAFVYDKLDISWIDKSKPMIAFTFDDGPVGSSDTSYSMRIQKALKEYNFHATFNYVTSKIGSEDMNNEILTAMENGHEIANHTSQWSSLSDTKVFADGEAVAAEIEKARKSLSELTGISDFTLRPPNLGQNDLVKDNCNVPLIGCNIISNDWEDSTTKEHIVEVTKGAKDGDIVLLHETMKNTAEAVEELVPYFAEQGYQIVSVVELFAAKDIPLYAGNYYNKAEYMPPRK